MRQGDKKNQDHSTALLEEKTFNRLEVCFFQKKV